MVPQEVFLQDSWQSVINRYNPHFTHISLRMCSRLCSMLHFTLKMKWRTQSLWITIVNKVSSITRLESFSHLSLHHFFVGSCFHLYINSIFFLHFLLSSLSSCANLFNKCFRVFISYFEQRKNDRR